ncbi:transposable element Tcb1 transposase [Trichonephila clavipes]|nr:transposable element Tcb1 transposase [Trichonephila clavipes]
MLGPADLERCHLYEDQSQDVLDRPVVEKTIILSHFSTRQCSASHAKGVTRLSPHCYYPSLACLILRFVSNRAYLESFGTVNWASHEFERTRGKDTANMERNISSHHTDLVYLNARSYPIVQSC